MQVRIASSSENAAGCLAGNVNAMVEDLETEIKLTRGNYGPYSGKKLKMLTDFRKTSKNRSGVTIPEYSL